MEDTWNDIREAVINRDEVCYRCQTDISLTVHHIIPRNEKGGDNFENLITLCEKCHDIVEIAGCRSLVEILATIDEPSKLWRVVNKSTPPNYKKKINIHFDDDPLPDIQPSKKRKPKPLATCEPKQPKKKVVREENIKRTPSSTDELRLSIIKRRNNGETYRLIADSLGVDPAMVQYIENNKKYKPSRKMKVRLNIIPGVGAVYTRARRLRLNEIAVSWGYTSWCGYETAILNQAWVSEATDNLIELRKQKEETDER